MQLVVLGRGVLYMEFIYLQHQYYRSKEAEFDYYITSSGLTSQMLQLLQMLQNLLQKCLMCILLCNYLGKLI